MPSPPMTDDELKRTVETYCRLKSTIKTAKALKLGRYTTVYSRLKVAKERGLWDGKNATFEQFDPAELPSEDAPIDELIESRLKQFDRKRTAKEARRLIPIRIKVGGPIAITHFGDPHIDDDGCNIRQLKSDIDTINATDGMFAANVGDLHNNWVGKLARLYGQQTTSARQAWQLVEWMINAVPWLYLIGGNHDAWSGTGDPLKWITQDQVGVYENWGVRLNLNFPNGKQLRINARHDFSGHSMWNPNHGPVKAIKAGWRDHILTCGHKHETGFGPPLKCPATGLISWPLRCAGYKVYDSYGDQLGLPDQNISPSITTVIDPQYDDNDPRLITPFLDCQEAAEYLTWKRSRSKGH